MTTSLPKTTTSADIEPYTFTDPRYPSPTSSYNINVRYYICRDEQTGETLHWDLGPTHEAALEALYNNKLDGSLRPVEFEQLVRHVFQARGEFEAQTLGYHTLLVLATNDQGALHKIMQPIIASITKLERQVRDLAAGVGLRKPGFFARKGR